jgi:hypothetical protein
MTDNPDQYAEGMDPETAGKSSPVKKIIIIVALVLLFLGTCCGGCIWAGFYLLDSASGMVLKPQIEGTPAIETYIGTIDEIQMDWSGLSQQGNSGRIIFDVSGDKGSGMLVVDPGKGNLSNADWSILEIDGKSYVVFGEPPADLGAEIVPEPEGSAPKTEASEATETPSTPETTGDAETSDSGENDTAP